jgi:O-antigen ligase
MKRRIVYAVLICCNLYALVYSFSRGSYVGFLVGLLFIGVVRNRTLLVLLLLFLFTWRSFVPLSVKERIDGSFVEEGTREDVITVGGSELETAGRKQIWQTALDSFAQQPFSGTGYNTFERLYGMDTHNVYLKTLAEQGVLGLLLYLLFYILAIRSGWRVYREGSEPFLKACGFGFLCATIGSMVVNLFGDRWTYLQVGGIYWVMWGLVDQEYTKWKKAYKEAEEGAMGPVPSPLLAPVDDESGG